MSSLSDINREPTARGPPPSLQMQGAVQRPTHMASTHQRVCLLAFLLWSHIHLLTGFDHRKGREKPLCRAHLIYHRLVSALQKEIKPSGTSRRPTARESPAPKTRGCVLLPGLCTENHTSVQNTRLQTVADAGPFVDGATKGGRWRSLFTGRHSGGHTPESVGETLCGDWFCRFGFILGDKWTDR